MHWRFTSIFFKFNVHKNWFLGHFVERAHVYKFKPQQTTVDVITWAHENCLRSRKMKKKHARAMVSTLEWNPIAPTHWCVTQRETTPSLVFDTFIWSYQRQRKNVLPIILCCQKEMDGDCVLRFPDISTSLFSHAGVSVNSAENKRGIWVWKEKME